MCQRVKGDGCAGIALVKKESSLALQWLRARDAHVGLAGKQLAGDEKEHVMCKPQEERAGDPHTSPHVPAARPCSAAWSCTPVE